MSAYPNHSTISRFRKRFALEIEDLFYQYARYLEGCDETGHGTVFIDGTKVESRAEKYSFCWRKSVEKQLGKLQEKTGCKTLKQVKKRLEQMGLCIPYERQAQRTYGDVSAVHGVQREEVLDEA